MPDLEESSLDPAIPQRCQECGVELTDHERDASMESGGPPLCSVHAAEVVPVSEEDPESGETAV